MFKLGDFAFDRMISAVAEANGKVQYILTQLQSATIETTAEAKEINDKDGNLVRKTYNSKKGTFTAPNAMCNVNILNASTGNELELATTEKPIDMPKFVTLKAGETVKLEAFVEGTISVTGVYGNGASGVSYSQAITASATEYGLTEAGVLTAPKVKGEDAPDKFLVKYMRKNTTGAVIRNSADKVPSTVSLTIKALYIVPCEQSVKAAYIYIPNFNVDPNVSISTTTDTQLEYKGDLGVDLCADKKDLYVIYFPDDEED